MDLFFNESPRFTQFIVARGLLQTPFVVVDVGVLGGENPRWQVLGDYLSFYGFDAGQEAIDALASQVGPRRTYRCIAIGDENGERDFYYCSGNPSSSSFVPAGEDRFTSEVSLYEKRRVPIRTIDSLIASGEVAPPDFLKIDVEGFELAVFRGAADCLSRHVLGLEFETSFNVAKDYRHSHIGTLQELLVPYWFRLFDLGFGRSARASYVAACRAAGLPAPPDGVLGQVGTMNVLFCQDFFSQADTEQIYPPSRQEATVDQLLKLMIIFELHGLVDVAFDIATRFGSVLAERVDVAHVQRLMLESMGEFPGTRDTMAADLSALLSENSRLRHECDRRLNRICELRNSTSWRITAPLRALGRFLKGDFDEAAWAPDVMLDAAAISPRLRHRRPEIRGQARRR